MAKLVGVYQREKESALLCRQIPLFNTDGVTMIMDLRNVQLAFENETVHGKELEEFLSKYKEINEDGVNLAFQVSYDQVLQVLNESVPCVGCRRSVERLLAQLADTGHPALDPLYVTPVGSVYIRDDHLMNPKKLCTMLSQHSSRLSSYLESQPRSKKSLRCTLHTLDSQRSRPVVGSCDWREVWDSMQPECRKEVLIIESATLLDRLNDYLRKHRFCGECRTKVLRAYSLLMEEPDPTQEKGYVATLYAGIRRCLPDKHIHLQCKTEYIDSLITRAEPELIGSRRERHAKTMETAQEEVLTCLGLCVYDRLHKINNRMREESTNCRMLSAVVIEALHRNFETIVEYKRGVSKSDILCEQLTKEELAKQQKKEYKKQRRRRRREKRSAVEEKENNFDDCECDDEEVDDSNDQDIVQCSCPDTDDVKPATQSTDTQKLQVLDRKSKGVPVCSCQDCRKRKKETCSLNGLVNSEDKKITNGVCDINTEQEKCNKRKNGYKTCTSSENLTNGNCDIVEEKTVCASPVNSSNKAVSPCKSCNYVLDKNTSSSDNSQDAGYSSENTNGSCGEVPSRTPSLTSTPDGSEIACSDGCCNHESDGSVELQKPHHVINGRKSWSGNGPVLTLEQMLEESCLSDEESYIPAEEIKEFQAQLLVVMEKRQALRLSLKKKFDQMCSTKGLVLVNDSTSN